MATASAVSIPITAVNKTANVFGSVTKGLGRVGVSVAKLGLAFSTLGVASGAVLVRNQMKAIDSLGKTDCLDLVVLQLEPRTMLENLHQAPIEQAGWAGTSRARSWPKNGY